LKRQLDWDFPDEHASTIAGLLIHEAQTIPSVGDHYFFHGFRFTVVEKDDTQLTSLRIEKLASAPIEDDVEL
jgi:Mg2+/Co2+ transporter CorB